MILADTEILKAIERGEIVIDPFDIDALGGNSYDVHLGDELMRYPEGVLDCRRENSTHRYKFEKVTLYPGRVYLASTIEYTETHKHVPYLDGKSSIGRLGISIHATAGRGDVGFCNHWTLELAVAQPVRVYAGMPIGQLTYHAVKGEVERRYDKKPSAKYNGRDARPQSSRMWRNFRDG